MKSKTIKFYTDWIMRTVNDPRFTYGKLETLIKDIYNEGKQDA